MPKECPLDRTTHLRRLGILCSHCLRNIAFYKAGWRNGVPVIGGEFWTTVNGNFMDICVLEWCKLFGDTKGKHYWKKVISKPDDFFSGLLQELEITEKDFNDYILKMRTYRDEFVAHLDYGNVMEPPVLDIARKSTSFLHDYLLTREDESVAFGEIARASLYYQQSLKEGRSIYRKVRIKRRFSIS